ncbi:hypothetical protein ACW5WG_21455, partial [Aeromonas salmonicida]
ADLRGMVVLRSLGFQLVPFKLHRFRKQRRCYYNRNTTKYNPSTVCDEWLQFSNFLVWWKDNYIEDFELDKDFKSLVLFGNPHHKLYSPETCQFIPKWMNLVHRTKHGKVMEIKQQLNTKPY